MKMTKIEINIFAAIRFTDGRPWIDCSSLALLPDMVQQKTAETARKIKAWAQGNPVLCIAPVKIIAEVPEKFIQQAQRRNT